MFIQFVCARALSVVVAVRIGDSGRENSSRIHLGDWVCPHEVDVGMDASIARRADGPRSFAFVIQ